MCSNINCCVCSAWQKQAYFFSSHLSWQKSALGFSDWELMKKEHWGSCGILTRCHNPIGGNYNLIFLFLSTVRVSFTVCKSRHHILMPDIDSIYLDGYGQMDVYNRTICLLSCLICGWQHMQDHILITINYVASKQSSKHWQMQEDKWTAHPTASILVLVAMAPICRGLSPS
jgi:hypothetical protein